MSTTSAERDRRTSTPTARYLTIAGLGLVLVWLMRFKSVSCAAASSACTPDARLLPAVAASIVLISVLALALGLTRVVPRLRSGRSLAVITFALVVAVVISVATVLFSAGFTLWPIWA